MSLGTTLKVSEFNKQALQHAAAVTNFDNYSFGTSLMSGEIVNEKGVMNFLSLKNLLDHVQEIGGEVFGSPIVANANQADSWLALLTAPIEIPVDYSEIKTVDFSTMATGNYDPSLVEKGKASIVKYDNQSVLQIGTAANVRIVAGFEVEPKAKYTITFWARPDKDSKDVSFTINFSGNPVAGSETGGKWKVKGGKWTKVEVEAKSPEDATDGYLTIENGKNDKLNIQKVIAGYTPDNHRPQTPQEITDTINYAINTWCDGLMKYNEGRIKLFDLIDEAIDNKELEPGIYDLKHSTDKVFWQDIFGSEEYAPTVSKVAKEAYEKYGGDPAALKFFISETGLENQKKFESLKYWISKWEAKNAKIDGVSVKLNLTYSEDAATQQANEASLNTLVENLADYAKNSGKLIRFSSFDIKFKDASGNPVSATNITETQRQKLANYYAYVIKKYMDTIQHAQQAGICKGNMFDTSDPVGLWSLDANKDYVRNATYKAFCDALSGK
jgi:hypothetical protein